MVSKRYCESKTFRHCVKNIEKKPKILHFILIYVDILITIYAYIYCYCVSTKYILFDENRTHNNYKTFMFSRRHTCSGIIVLSKIDSFNMYILCFRHVNIVSRIFWNLFIPFTLLCIIYTYRPETLESIASFIFSVVSRGKRRYICTYYDI